jgi:transposase, IS5 family
VVGLPAWSNDERIASIGCGATDWSQVLRTTNPQQALWEAILPEPCRLLPAELAAADRLLDDPVFMAPLATSFHATLGRPSIPLDTYLRMMFLKFRHRLGYELLCREVADSICWQRFCRIPLGGQVPHPTTLAKLTRRMGEQTVGALNHALLAKAAEQKLLRTRRLRADTTVVAANIGYPTDAGLLARAVGKLARGVERVQAAGGAPRTRTRDRRRAVRRRAHQLAKSLRCRTDQAKTAVARRTGELADLAEAATADAVRVARNTRRALARAGTGGSGRLRRLVADLETTIGRTARIVDQTRTRLAGQTPRGPPGCVACTIPTPPDRQRAIG